MRPAATCRPGCGDPRRCLCRGRRRTGGARPAGRRLRPPAPARPRPPARRRRPRRPGRCRSTGRRSPVGTGADRGRGRRRRRDRPRATRPARRCRGPRGPPDRPRRPPPGPRRRDPPGVPIVWGAGPEPRRCARWPPAERAGRRRRATRGRPPWRRARRGRCRASRARREAGCHGGRTPTRRRRRRAPARQTGCQRLRGGGTRGRSPTAPPRCCGGRRWWPVP